MPSLDKNIDFGHTKAMSEMGEMPKGPKPEQIPPQPRRLEDMPEFQKLAPEQQEKLLTLRERLMQESMEPKQVVSRSINEMGFWDGLKETVKPHMEKQKKLMFNELKANASLALSLIPILGEGKGFSTGLLGITKAKDLKWVDVSAQAFRDKKIIFEPIARGTRAVNAAKEAYTTARAASAVGALGEKASVWSRVAARTQDTLRPVGAVLAGKSGIEKSLITDFTTSAAQGADILASKIGVAEVRAAQVAGKKAEQAAYMGAKMEATAAAGIQDMKWHEFIQRWWKSRGVEKVAKGALKSAKADTAKNVAQAINAGFDGRNVNKAQKWVETGVKKVAPKAIEASKFGQFQAFTERWLNLTPDVPIWLSTTTGVLEFLGMHGIDAVPAVIQKGVNQYKQVMITKDMAFDVLDYTAKRVIGTSEKQKQAADTFAPKQMEPAMA